MFISINMNGMSDVSQSLFKTNLPNQNLFYVLFENSIPKFMNESTIQEDEKPMAQYVVHLPHHTQYY